MPCAITLILLQTKRRPETGIKRYLVKRESCVINLCLHGFHWPSDCKIIQKQRQQRPEPWLPVCPSILANRVSHLPAIFHHLQTTLPYDGTKNRWWPYSGAIPNSLTVSFHFSEAGKTASRRYLNICTGTFRNLTSISAPEPSAAWPSPPEPSGIWPQYRNRNLLETHLGICTGTLWNLT